MFSLKKNHASGGGLGAYLAMQHCYLKQQQSIYSVMTVDQNTCLMNPQRIIVPTLQPLVYQSVYP